jgi:acyl carrier protein
MSQDNVLNRLVGIIESMVKLPAGSIDVEADFAELGINSLIVMELIESIAAEFEVTLTPAQFTDVSTVSELAELLGRLKKGASGEAAAQAGDSLDVLKFISQKYAVDLSSRELGSVDEMVDALVADHSEDLMRHYGMESEEGSGGAVRFHDIAIVGMSCRLPDASDAKSPHRDGSGRIICRTLRVPGRLSRSGVLSSTTSIVLTRASSTFPCTRQGQWTRSSGCCCRKRTGRSKTPAST